MRSPRASRRCPARSITPRTSARPASTALSSSKAAPELVATIRASVVLPSPEGRRGPSSAGGRARSPSAAPMPSPSRWLWPTTSSSPRGRIRAASGASPTERDRWAAPARRCRTAGPQHEYRARHVRRVRRRAGDDDHRARRRDLLSRLLRFDTVNPPGDELPAQELLAELLARRASRSRWSARTPSRPNLVARLRGTGTARRCACSRTSTRCSRTPAEWQRDPWSGEVVDGVVWGRGALDMKTRRRRRSSRRSSLAREGWRPARGDLLVVVRRRRGGRRRPTARSGSATTTPSSCAATTSSTRAPGR